MSHSTCYLWRNGCIPRETSTLTPRSMVVLSAFVYNAKWQAVHYAGISDHSTVRSRVLLPRNEPGCLWTTVVCAQFSVANITQYEKVGKLPRYVAVVRGHHFHHLRYEAV